ncbi:MAG TPA: copper amine oxidase N-terminal domain-containing protein [Caldisericia bacterium]|nr:copper amine oxidase N-terminal domain-containing protein [Caldisericia bacterium]
MVARKFMSIILAGALLFGLLPIGSAQAASVTVSGVISSVSCYSSIQVSSPSLGKVFDIAIVGSTVITVNGAVSPCTDLQPNMGVTVVGVDNGGRIIASKIAAQGAGSVKKITASGKIVSTYCPNAIVVATSSGNIQFDISRAMIMGPTGSLSCEDLEAGDPVIVSGEQRADGSYYASYVKVNTGSVGFVATGKISSISCSSGEMVLQATSQTVKILIGSAKFTLNGKSVSCDELKAGDSAQVKGTLDKGVYTAQTVAVTRETGTFNVTGKIASISCPSVVSITVSGGMLTIRITQNTIIKKGGVVASCSDLQVGDSVTVSGTVENGIYVADIISATSQVQTFNLSGTIEATNCPSEITLKTSSGTFTIDVSQAQIKIGGTVKQCSDLKQGDIAYVSGVIQNGKKIAQTVTVTSSGQTTVSIEGTVFSKNCQANMVTVKKQNGIIVQVVLPQSFTRNGNPSTCDDIKVGDNAYVEGTQSGATIIATKAEFAGETGGGETKTVSGKIITIDCQALLMVLETESGAIQVRFTPLTKFFRNNISAECSELMPGDTASATGIESQGILVAETVYAIGEGGAIAQFEGKITSVDCVLMKMTIKYNDLDIVVMLQGATIKKDGATINCVDLKVGDTVIVWGNIVPTEAKVIAVKVEVVTSGGGGGDCNGPFTYTGKIEMVNCLGQPQTIILVVGNTKKIIFITSSTKITINGKTATCQQLKAGMTVTVTGNCVPDKGLYATEITSGQSESELGIVSGILGGTSCYYKKISVMIDGEYDYTVFMIDDQTEIIVDGVKTTCAALRSGMRVVVTYKEVGNPPTLVAVKIVATTPTNPPPPTPPPGGGSGGGSGGGGGGTPPTPPGGGGSGGGTTPSPGENEGQGFESVLTVTKIDCAGKTIEGTDEYNAGTKMTVKLGENGTINYKDQQITCDKLKVGYLIKVNGVRGKGTSVNATVCEILPVSPLPNKINGRIVEVDKVKGWVKLEPVKSGISTMSVSGGVKSDGDYVLVYIDPTTTFEYRGRKLTIQDLRPGVMMEISGLVDPINSVMTTNTITLSARQAIDVTQKGRVADVFCDKSMFWLITDDPESKYVLIKLSTDTAVTLEGNKATCADLVKGAEVTVTGKLDPFDLYVSAQKVEALKLQVGTATIEGEMMALDSTRQQLWIKISDEQGTRFVMVKYSTETKFLAFGKTGTVADLVYASVLTVTGSYDPNNQFIFNAGTVESLGKSEENLSSTGTVVFADCVGKIIFIKTQKGVERFELVSSTKITSGDKPASCADIKEGQQVTITYDRKGTKVFTTKLTLPPPKTIIKLTVGLGVISVNGQNVLIDAPPYVKGGTTMVPIRVVTAYFGASLTWGQADKRLTLQRGKDIIIVWIGRQEALVNGKSTPLAQAPEYGAADRMMVPLRFFSEVFGAQVEWDQASKTITIIL